MLSIIQVFLLPYVIISHLIIFCVCVLTLLYFTGNMKVPPNQVDDVIGSNSVDNTEDSDDGLNDAPHSPSREGDFSEYLWMENEEEFEEQISKYSELKVILNLIVSNINSLYCLSYSAAAGRGSSYATMH